MVTFGIQPAGATSTDSRGFFDLSVQPGATLFDHVAVTNYSRKRLTLHVATADATNTTQGGFALVPTRAGDQDVGQWISLPARARTVTVPPRNLVIIPFRVVVPPDATPGDHAGGIVATLQSEAVSASGQRFKLLQRVGTRVFARVGGALHAKLSISRLSAQYNGSALAATGGTTTVTYLVRNTGNVAIGGRQRVRVSGLFGSSATARPADIRLLLPGSAVTESVTVPAVMPQLRMSASVSLSPLVIAGSATTPGGPFAASTHFWAIPVAWLLVAAVVLFAAVLWVRRRRRAAVRRRAGGEVAGDVLAGVTARVRSTAGRGRHRVARGGPSGVAVLVLVGATAFVLSARGTAYADDSAPYHDPSAKGAIGLCDRAGNAITSGSLRTRPFVWSAISSVAAPAGYEHGKVELLAFQPRQEIDPSEWSGSQLTASSSFTNPSHPVAQATTGDSPLLYFAQAFPPQWKGFIELRLYYTGPQAPVFRASYPATDIKVTGDSWKVVRPVRVDCHSGRGVSSETQLLPASDFPSPVSVKTFDRTVHGTGWGPARIAVTVLALFAAAVVLLAGFHQGRRRRTGRHMSVDGNGAGAAT